MNDHHEDRIDTVLAGLRKAQPVAGMEARVLARLRRAEESHVRGKAGWLPAWDVSWASYAVAAAIVAAAAGALLYPYTVSHRPANHSAVAQRPPSSAGSSIAVDRDVAASTEPTATSRPVRRTSIRLLRVMENRPAQHPSHAEEDISFPAPPLPLTEQERLLLQLAHREPAQQLAQLTSATLNSGFLQEKEAVTEFFAPRPPLPGQQEPPPYVLQTGQQ